MDTKFRSIRQCLLFITLGIVLTACDGITIDSENRNRIPAKKQLSNFFHPIKDGQPKFKIHNIVYVPVYSNIFVSGGGKLNMAITLTIRNTDFISPLVVNEVSYYNTAGELIENYLEQPYVLDAMASTHFFVTQADLRGGVGANFIISWSAQPAANKPVIEAVMAGSKGTHGISFINAGVAIKGRH